MSTLRTFFNTDAIVFVDLKLLIMLWKKTFVFAVENPASQLLIQFCKQMIRSGRAQHCSSCDGSFIKETRFPGEIINSNQSNLNQQGRTQYRGQVGHEAETVFYFMQVIHHSLKSLFFNSGQRKSCLFLSGFVAEVMLEFQHFMIRNCAQTAA